MPNPPSATAGRGSGRATVHRCPDCPPVPGPPVVSLPGYVGEIAIHNPESIAGTFLAVGVDLHEHAKRIVLMVPTDVAQTLFAGREVSVEIRLR